MNLHIDRVTFINGVAVAALSTNELLELLDNQRKEMQRLADVADELQTIINERIEE
jgi:hypothetical protein